MSSLAETIQRSLKRCFTGFDNVQVVRYEQSNMSEVRLLVTDESFHDINNRRFRHVHLSSRGSEELITKRADQGLRFYGRPAASRKRGRFR
jgi:hypothetical protein